MATLTNLGTDTDYTPEPDLAYKHGETLSVLSSLIENKGEVKYDPTSLTPYVSEEVTVVKGPSTLGTDVRFRIQEGLLTCLRAISKGDEVINIMAHSRGAVESILETHELDALQKKIAEIKERQTREANTKDSQTGSKIVGVVGAIAKVASAKIGAATAAANANKSLLRQAIEELAIEEAKRLASGKSNTGIVLQDILKLHGNELDELSDGVCATMPNVGVNLIALDPVPGNVIFNFTWVDERYYSIPEIVKQCEIYYYENEHSRCFMPVKPSTKFNNLKIFTLPGHHGTGSNGNNLDQRGNEYGLKTSDVQVLLFCKLMSFLTNNGTIFKKPEDWPLKDNSSSLQSVVLSYTKNLKKLKNPDADNLADTSLVLPSCYKVYKEIFKNREAYLRYNTTCYSTGLSNAHDRYVATQESQDNLLSKLLPATYGFVNAEHLALVKEHLLNKFGVKDVDADLSNIIEKLLEKLSKGLHSEKNKFTELFRTKENKPNLEGQKVIMSIFKTLLENATERYLHNSLKEEEKDNLLNLLANTFAQLDTILKTLPLPEVKEFLSSDTLMSEEQSFIKQLSTTLKDDVVGKINRQFEHALTSADYVLAEYLSPLDKTTCLMQYVHQQFTTEYPHKVAEVLEQVTTSTEYKKLTTLWDQWTAIKEALEKATVVTVKDEVETTSALYKAEQITELNTVNAATLQAIYQQAGKKHHQSNQKALKQVVERLQAFSKDLDKFKKIKELNELDYDSIDQNLLSKAIWLLHQTPQDSELNRNHFTQIMELLEILQEDAAPVAESLTMSLQELMQIIQMHQEDKAEFEATKTEFADEKAQLETARAKFNAEIEQFEKAKATFTREKSTYEAALSTYQENSGNFEATRMAYEAEKAKFVKANTQFLQDQLKFEATRSSFDKDKAKYATDGTEFAADKTLFERAKATFTEEKAAFEERQAQFESVEKAYQTDKAQFEIAKTAFQEEKNAFDDAKLAFLSACEEGKLEFETAKALFRAEKAQFDESHVKFLEEKAAFESIRPTLENGQAQFEAAKIAYETEKAEFEAARAKFLEEKTAYEATHSSIEQAPAQLEVARMAYETEKAEFELAHAKFLEEKQAFEANNHQLENGQAQFEAAKTAYETEKAEFEAARAKFLEEKTAYEATHPSIEQDPAQFEVARMAYETDKAEFELAHAKFLEEKQAFEANNHPLENGQAQFEAAKTAYETEKAEFEVARAKFLEEKKDFDTVREAFEANKSTLVKSNSELEVSLQEKHSASRRLSNELSNKTMQILNLENERNRLIEQMDDLTTELSNKDRDIAARDKAIFDLKQQTPKEVLCRGIVLDLMRISVDYEEHLAKQPGSELKDKKIVELDDLTSTLFDEKLLYSERVSLFNAKLKGKEQLPLHRNTEWRTFWNTCVIVLTLATGIIPGLIVLGLNASLRERQSLLFWNSQGKNFIKEAESILEDAPEVDRGHRLE